MCRELNEKDEWNRVYKGELFVMGFKKFYMVEKNCLFFW